MLRAGFEQVLHGGDEASVERGAAACLSALRLILTDCRNIMGEVDVVRFLYEDLELPAAEERAAGGSSSAGSPEPDVATSGGTKEPIRPTFGTGAQSAKEVVQAALTMVQAGAPTGSAAGLLNSVLEADRPLQPARAASSTSGDPNRVAVRVRRMSRAAQGNLAFVAIRIVQLAACAAPRLVGKRMLGVAVSQAAMSTSRSMQYTLLCWQAACAIACGAGPPSLTDLGSLVRSAVTGPVCDTVSIEMGSKTATGAVTTVVLLQAKERSPIDVLAAAMHLRACVVPVVVAAVGARMAPEEPTSSSPVQTTCSAGAPSSSSSSSSSSASSSAAATPAASFEAARQQVLALCLDTVGAACGSLQAKIKGKCASGTQAYGDAMVAADRSAAGLGDEARNRVREAAARTLLQGPTLRALAVLRSCQQELSAILSAGQEAGSSGWALAESIEEGLKGYVTQRVSCLAACSSAAVKGQIRAALRVPAVAMGPAAFEEAWAEAGGEAGAGAIGAGAIGAWQDVLDWSGAGQAT